MSDVINFATASQTIDFIQNANAQVSGMSMAEAERALGSQVASNGMRLVGFEGQAGANAVTQFPSAQTATEAFESFEASGGLTSGANAALIGSGSIGAGTVALASSQSIPTGVVGVAAGSAGLVAAGAAPIFGAALGVGLYEIAPDFWTRVSQTLLPWVWEDLDIMPVVYDESGNTYVPQAAINALADLFSTTEILPEYRASGSYVVESYSNLTDYVIGRFQALNPQYTFNISEATYNHMNSILQSGYCIVRVFKFPSNTYNFSAPLIIIWKATSSPALNSTITLSTTENVRGNLYSYSAVVQLDGTINMTSRPSGSSYSKNYFIGATTGTQAGSIYEYYEDTSNMGITSGYQEGVEQWQGDAYPSNPNTIDVLTGYDANEQPVYETYQQIALPIGDPLVTNDPLIQPDPYYNPSPEVDPQTGAIVYPAIDPYVSPIANPNQFPDTEEIPSPDEEQRTAPLPSIENVPQIEPVPLPEINPALDPITEPTPIPEPIPATSGGISGFPSLPIFPLFPDGSAGLYHVYNPTNAQLQSFGSWLWTTFSGNLIDTLSKLFNNPMDAVISLQEFYGTPNIQGSGTIRCGYLDSEIPSALVGNRYSSINCGTIIIPEYYGNYLDYAPYTQVIIYLPFVGFMSLNADDIIGNAVQVVYHIDSYTGSVIAIVTVARNGYESVMYQFEGNCSVDVPVTGGQQSSIKGAIIGGISGAVAGGVAGAAVGAVLGGLSTKNDVQHSGSFSASYGAMGAKIPFIVVRRPVQKIVYNYSESYGYPAHKMVYVGNCRGYLRAREVRVLSTTATNEEKQLIVNALKSGVYVKN